MHIVVVGCGRVGAHAASALSRLGHTVVVVDRDQGAFRRLPRNFAGTTLVGVGFDRETLEKAGIDQADAFVAVTNGDNTNIISARVAKETYHVPTVVSRIYDPQRAEIYRRFGVQTFTSTVWAAGRIVDLITSPLLLRELTLANGEVEVLHTVVQEAQAGMTPAGLNASGEIMVVAVTRMGRAFIPAPDTPFEAGDHLHVAVSQAAIEKFQKAMGLQQ